jgi:excinuclease ABC subunit C
MKRCGGPCCDLVGKGDYDDLVGGTVLFLKGRSDELVAELQRHMLEAGAAERFEEAARLRDQIAAVERTIERQQIVGERPVDRDVFGLARKGGEACVQVLLVREGRVVGTQDYGFSEVRLDDGDVMSSFLGQYYGREHERQIPDEVLTPRTIDDDGGLQSLLAERAGRKIGLRVPRRGAMAELVQMANRNAELTLARRIEARASVDTALAELRDRLSLRATPRRIEGYDVSTLHGTLTVASRVCFEDGQPRKQDYRRYRIKEAAPDDDYAALREVFARRLARVDAEPLPDLFLVDGGKGQLAVLCAALADAGLSADAVGLSKERDAESPSPRVRRSGGLKAERVFLAGRRNPVMLPPSSRGLLFLQRVRDESHRFAIEFQRSLRSKQNFTSILEELPGIGPKKRQVLLRELGSLRAVRAASEAELRAVVGISPRDAATIRRFFDALAGDSDARKGS